MFFHKDLFLLDFLPELKKSGLSYLRLDLRHVNFSNKLIKKINYLITNFEKSKIDELKALWPAKITHGFFRANRTDLAIERIKNPYLNNNSENLVGFVIESVKDKYIALIARKDFACGDGERLIGITPEVKKCTILTNDIKTSN